MKNEYELDQLLNAYIDGQCSLREQNEVKRLIAHDAHAAQRLNELEKCKLLLQSLPAEKAPAGILNNAIAQLSSKDEPEEVWRPKRQFFGIIQLFLRKSIAAAALLLLVSGLLIMIGYIVAPPQSTTIVNNPLPPPGNEITQPNETRVASVYAARLELKAKTPEAAYAMGNMLKENFAADDVIETIQTQSTAYVVNCTSEKIAGLSKDLQLLWKDFSDARLFVDANEPGKAVVVNNVKPDQFANILSQNNLETQIKAASYFAFINNIGTATSQNPITGGTISSPNNVPPPRLAQTQRTNPAVPPPIIRLTIEISAE
jgi:hypothetical protein